MRGFSLLFRAFSAFASRTFELLQNALPGTLFRAKGASRASSSAGRHRTAPGLSPNLPVIAPVVSIPTIVVELSRNVHLLDRIFSGEKVRSAGGKHMVSLVLSHDTALSYWNHGRGGLPSSRLRPEDGVELFCSPQGAVPAALLKRHVHDEIFEPLVYPLDLLVSQRVNRRAPDIAKFHYLGAPLPEGALIPVMRTFLYFRGEIFSVLTVSPEMCFVQMAQLLGDTELAELGFELCGSYAIDPRDDTGIRNREPVTNPERLVAFCDAAVGLHGAKRARKVARSILSGSRSPRESQLALFSTLPLAKGGFALPAPLLNSELAVPEPASFVLGYDKITPDLYWPEAKVAIEYDSSYWHSDTEQLEADARRRNVYRMLGIESFTITKGQFSNLCALRSIFQHVEKRLLGYTRTYTLPQVSAQARLHSFFVSAQRSIRRPQ